MCPVGLFTHKLTGLAAQTFAPFAAPQDVQAVDGVKSGNTTTESYCHIDQPQHLSFTLAANKYVIVSVVEFDKVIAAGEVPVPETQAGTGDVRTVPSLYFLHLHSISAAVPVASKFGLLDIIDIVTVSLLQIRCLVKFISGRDLELGLMYIISLKVVPAGTIISFASKPEIPDE